LNYSGTPSTYGNYLYYNGSTFAVGGDAANLRTIRLGDNAGINSLENSIAIGNNAGRFTQANSAIAIGDYAGETGQNLQTIAIGRSAGKNGQSNSAIAIGTSAGINQQSTSAIAIGVAAGFNSQKTSAIAIGSSAGVLNQGINAVAIGSGAGQSNQYSDAIAIGTNAGVYNQSQSGIAIGRASGQTGQGMDCIAIGFGAGRTAQGGLVSQGSGFRRGSIAIGSTAGASGQAEHAIAIGYLAGATQQSTQSIILNASGIALNVTAGVSASSLYVKPIASTSVTANPLVYDTGTGKVSYTTGKTFVIDHPTNNDKHLVHACLEGPEVGVYYRGEGVITNNENTIIKLPDYVDKIAYQLTVNLTPINDDGTKKQLILTSSRVKNNEFTVYGPNCEFFWTVYGKRQDIDVEPLKQLTNVKGIGPYKWI
jgi:hypothetical protein